MKRQGGLLKVHKALFRAKTLSSRELVEGWYLIIDGISYVLPVGGHLHDIVEVDPSTVGQCNDKWISVKDRLPEAEREKFRGEYKDDELEVNCMLKGAKIATTLYYDGIGFKDGSGVHYTVTHWMPLPEPPGEEG